MSESYIQFFREPSIQPFEIPVESHSDGLDFLSNMQKRMSTPLRSHDFAVLITDGSRCAFGYIASKKNKIAKESNIPSVLSTFTMNNGASRSSLYSINRIADYKYSWNTYWHHEKSIYGKLIIADNVGIDKKLIADVILKMNSDAFGKNGITDYMKYIMSDLLSEDNAPISKHKASEAIEHMRSFVSKYESQSGKSAYEVLECYEFVAFLFVRSHQSEYCADLIQNMTRHMTTEDTANFIDRSNKTLLRKIKLEMILERL